MTAGARDFPAEYRAARMAATTAREAGHLTNPHAALADEILAAADAAGVDVPIAAIERDVDIAHGLPVWPPVA